MSLRLFFSILALLSLALVAVGCGDDDDDDDGGEATTAADGEGTDVAVTLQEFEITLDTESGAAGGPYTFTITNDGPDDIHEFVVFKTDLAPDALPIADDGSVDEEGEGVELVDEVEDVAVGATETLDVELAAGNYVFICNIAEEHEGELEVHYELGMRTGFTVE